MAAILNGFLPLRKKDQYVDDRVLNTRWGDAAITAPIHGGWNNTNSAPTQPQESPDLDRDLPPTPPQNRFNEQDGVFIVRDDDDRSDRDTDKDSITVTIPLPWRRKKQPPHGRKASINNVLNPRFTASTTTDLMAPLGTVEAAALPLPESRVSSPVARHATTSPVLSFRTRLASPNLGDILSPVVEGFAKDGPSQRPTPVLSPLQFAQTIQADRPSPSSSLRSNITRRPSVNGYPADGLMSGTMSSQAISDEQAPDYVRPSSRGLGSTACMRASSRGPRANSRGPRATSVEPFPRRAPSAESLYRRREASTEPIARQRELSIEPVNRRREPSAGPEERQRDTSPARRRAPSIDSGNRRAPSVGPRAERRAISREPRGRRGLSIEPVRVRFRSEAPYQHRRKASNSSANDASADSESEAEQQPGRKNRFKHFDKESRPTRRPRRRRSIASPITSPTFAAFNISQVNSTPAQPVLAANSNHITNAKSANASLTQTSPPPVPIMGSIPPPVSQRSALRPHSMSRTRGLYADMHDDFRLLARDVHMATTVPTQPAWLDRAPSPIIGQPSVGIAATLAQPQSPSYYSDSPLPSTYYQSLSSNTNRASMLPASGFNDRRDQGRRDERERAREKLMRKLEKERDIVLSGDESAMSGNESKTRRVYGGSVDIQFERKVPGKTMVPDANEIWG